MRYYRYVRGRANPNSLLLSVKRRGDEGEQMRPSQGLCDSPSEWSFGATFFNIARGLRANRGSNDLVIRSDKLELEGSAGEGFSRGVK